MIFNCIFPLLLLVIKSFELVQGDCTAKLEERCESTVDCCLGTCLAGYCNDGLYKNNKDRSVSADASDQIAAELSTGQKVDVSEHPNIGILPTYEECGFPAPGPRRQKRIYPWAVALHLNVIQDESSYFSCGASLITKRHVLTAAHCVTRISTGIMLKKVTLGIVDRRLKSECEKANSCKSANFIDAEVLDWTAHESYSEAHVRNDVAIIRLKEDVKFTDNIRPICLPRSEDMLKQWPDGTLTVIGWGTQNTASDDGPKKVSSRAQELENYLVHRSNCDRFYTRNIGHLRRSHICAGGYPGKSDCAGDSGGPLFKRLQVGGEDGSEGMERYFQFGLVSTGAVVNCAREGKPSVYTSVLSYMPWILDNLEAKPKTVGDYIDHKKFPVDPVVEFATGIDPPMDMSKHKATALLPKFPDCGPIFGKQDPKFPSKSNHTQHRVKRIVEGIAQTVGVYPWMVQIYARHVTTTDLNLRCGGFLISSRHVITGAHCVGDVRGSYVIDGVVLGNFNRLESRECIEDKCNDMSMVAIEEVVAHEKLSKYSREYDVAIIKLARDVKFTRFIQPICLPLSEDMVKKAWPTGSDLKYTAAGWGRVDANSNEAVMSNILIAMNSTIESKKYCEAALTRLVGRLEHSRVCAGGSRPGKGECVGDTGGPMMRWVTMKGPDGKDATRMYAFGVLSVVECAHQGIPALYQNLLYHLPWIMDSLETL